jgi:hypothetical protein
MLMGAVDILSVMVNEWSEEKIELLLKSLQPIYFWGSYLEL